MLTKEQYRALCRYRDANVPVDKNGLSEVDMYLREQGYIEPAEMKASTYLGIFQISSVSHRITELGRTALKEYRKEKRGLWFQVFLVILGVILTLLAGKIDALFC